MGEINNSAKVMDTCRQQSTVNGIEVTSFTPIGSYYHPSVSYALVINHIKRMHIVF